MINAIAAYIVSWAVIFFFKFIGMFTGVTFLVSPDSFMYSTIVYFTLFYFLNKKFNPEKNDSTANLIVSIALLPYALILSTVLHWNGSYHCQKYFVKDGYIWPNPSDYEAGTWTLALMNGDRKRCLTDPFNYFGGFESSVNGWLLILSVVLLGLALLLITIFLFGLLREMGVKEIIFELRHGATKSEVKEKKKRKEKITRGIGKTGREVVNWKGKVTDILKDEDFHGKDDFIFYRANVLDIIEKEHLSKGDYLVWFGRMGEEYADNYSKHKDKYPRSEVIEQIKWALSHLTKVYTGQSSVTGKKREKKLSSVIEKIECL